MGTTNLVVDTNIIIEYFRNKVKRNTYLSSIPTETKLFLSAVTLYELYMGAPSEDKRKNIEELVENFTILPFDDDVARQAAVIYNDLKKANQLIEFRDIFIAATCLVHRIPLKTTNTNHFNRIKGIELYRLNNSSNRYLCLSKLFHNEHHILERTHHS